MKKAAILITASFLMANGASAAETEHLVAKGDTLYKLTRQYGVTIDQLKQWNKLSSDQVFIGQRLAVSSTGNTMVMASPPVDPVDSSDKVDKPFTNPVDSAGKVDEPPVSPVQSPDRTNKPPVPLSFVSVSGDQVNFRKAADLTSQVLFRVKKGTKVELLEAGDQWSKVKMEGAIGYMASAFLDREIPPTNLSSRSFDSFETRMQNVIASLLGIPYATGGASLDGFDCSGFTKYVMEQFGVSLPRVSEEQFAIGTPVEREDLQMGDLLFFDSYGTGKITHVAIYIGDNKIAHSATKEVEISDATWYFNHYPYYGAKRVLPKHT